MNFDTIVLTKLYNLFGFHDFFLLMSVICSCFNQESHIELLSRHFSLLQSVKVDQFFLVFDDFDSFEESITSLSWWI